MERREEISSYYVKRKNPISTRSGRLFFLSKNDEILASEVQLFHYAVLKQVVENEKKEHISAMAKLSKDVDSNKKGCPKEQPLTLE